MKIKKVKDIDKQEVMFTAKSLENPKDSVPSIKTSVEDVEKIEKEFKKNLNKIHKFESFITINIDNIENVDWETENEFEEDDSEISGCGCCQDCSGDSDCECGCEDCVCCESEHGEKKNSKNLTIFPFLKM
jgi:hypothetical protein